MAVYIRLYQDTRYFWYTPYTPYISLHFQTNEIPQSTAASMGLLLVSASFPWHVFPDYQQNNGLTLVGQKFRICRKEGFTEEYFHNCIVYWPPEVLVVCVTLIFLSFASRGGTCANWTALQWHHYPGKWREYFHLFLKCHKNLTRGCATVISFSISVFWLCFSFFIFFNHSV